MAPAETQRIATKLDSFTMEVLKAFYRGLAGSSYQMKGKKRDLSVAVASLVSFKDQGAFDVFYAGLPPLTQEAVRIGAFNRFVSVGPLEKKYGSPILEEVDGYGYERSQELNTHLRMDFFLVADWDTLLLPEAFRRAFVPWLPKPPEWELHSVPAPERAVWSNVEFMREAAPLLSKMAEDALHEKAAEALARKGLLKAELKKYRSAFTLGEFPVASTFGLDSIDLFVRLAACLEPLRSQKTSDGDEFLKRACSAFLSPDNAMRTRYRLDGAALEYLTLIDHLSRTPGFRVSLANEAPPSRSSFADLLREIGSTGAWYSTEALYRYLIVHDKPFYFLSPYEEADGLRLRCTGLRVGSLRYELDPYEDGLFITGAVRSFALDLPLFKAYCYVAALLGIVEIAELDPELVVEKKGKMIPLSPYDAVAAVRVSDFGAWCLGLSKEKPKAEKRVFEAIADRDLLLVTFRGASLERRLLLENIGTKLGEDRYRITEASFIRTCERVKDIEQRIESFRRLIEASPSPRWEAFFASVRARASLFSSPMPAFLYPLPKDGELAKAIVIDPLIRPLILRAEGGFLVVRAADHKKFTKALADSGWFNEEW